MKVAVTGSSGLIGTALTASLRADGHQVVRLVRRPPRAGRRAITTPQGDQRVRWDPRAADAGDPALSGVDAVRAPGWRGGRRPPLDGRLQGGDPGQPGARHHGARAPPLAATRPRPAAFIVASAIGWYGDTGGREVTEDAPAGKAFLSRVVARLGGRRRPCARGGHPRRAPAQRPRPRRRRRRSRAAGAARPLRAAAPLRRRPPGDELDLAHRRDPRDPLPARRRRHSA